MFLLPTGRYVLTQVFSLRYFQDEAATQEEAVRIIVTYAACEVLIRDMLFADDAAVVAHTQEGLQSLMDCFSQACKDFGLTISLKKTNVLGQDTETPPVITIDDYELDAVCQFTYLGSTITDNLSLAAEINKRIGKAASTLARLTARVWTSSKLSVKTNMAV